MKSGLAASFLLATCLGACAHDGDALYDGKDPVESLVTGKGDLDVEVIDNGVLTPGEEASASVREGEGQQWTFTLSDAARVTLETAQDGEVTDTILHLHRVVGDAMEEVATDDDGGEDYYSRIEAQLEPGTYKVTVTGYRDAAGPFALRSSQVAVPTEDPWRLARDINVMNVGFGEETPIPVSYSRPQNVGSLSLSSPEWWQRWSGGATQSFSWNEGTDHGKRCGQANAIRLEALWADAEGQAAFQELLDGSGWSGTMYNWTEDVSEGGRTAGFIRGATLWAWRTGAVKFINVVHDDGSCDLPTLAIVKEFSRQCLDAARNDDGAIEGCIASSQ